VCVGGWVWACVRVAACACRRGGARRGASAGAPLLACAGVGGLLSAQRSPLTSVVVTRRALTQRRPIPPPPHTHKTHTHTHHPPHTHTHTASYLQQRGWDVTYLPVEKDGRVNLGQLEEAMRPETALVSVMAVNNEIGEHGAGGGAVRRSVCLCARAALAWGWGTRGVSTTLVCCRGACPRCSSRPARCMRSAPHRVAGASSASPDSHV
jgi:hypothetical protein